jgi:hypothetical protein
MLQCSKRLLRASLGVSSLNSGRLRAVFFVCGLDRIWPETKPRAYPVLAVIQQSPKIPAVARLSGAIASDHIAGAAAWNRKSPASGAGRGSLDCEQILWKSIRTTGIAGDSSATLILAEQGWNRKKPRQHGSGGD